MKYAKGDGKRCVRIGLQISKIKNILIYKVDMGNIG